MSKLKVAVIGAGSISDCHLQAYVSNPDVEIYAICDLNAERAAEVAKQYNAPHVFTDYKELLGLPEIHSVSICTWNDSHAEISIAALDAGKNVLCEKPLCQTVEDALEVEKAVHRSGKLLQVGFVRRYSDNAQILKKFIDEGEPGRDLLCQSLQSASSGQSGWLVLGYQPFRRWSADRYRGACDRHMLVSDGQTKGEIRLS